MGTRTTNRLSRFLVLVCALGLPVLPTNDEDGVAVAIERHVLGRT